MPVMDELAVPEGYQVELFDGRIVMTPRTPEKSMTAFAIGDALDGLARAEDRAFGNVLIRFPGENDAAPDFIVLTTNATRTGDSFFSHDVLLVVEVPSELDDEKDYGETVKLYLSTGEVIPIDTSTFPSAPAHP